LDYTNIPISGSTKIYGLIGDPIDHSLSPAIQNAAFRSTGLNAVYVPFPIGKAKLSSAIHGLKALGVKGFNVTTPYKTATLRYVDKVDTEAAELGSINTVKNEGDELTGFDTDGPGAISAIEQAGTSVRGRTFLMLGAGGAACAIAYALAGRGCSLRLTNRTLPKARNLAKALHAKFGVKTECIPLSRHALRQSLRQADIILNASSMGMSGRHNPPIERNWIRKDQWVFDIVYRPTQTKLLRDAASVGARTINGLDLLVNQGARSFTLWTGRKAPINEMRRAIGEKVTIQNARSR
jgi:shikimate dehydrogenase